MELQDYVRIIRKYMWVSLLGAVALGAIGQWANWYTNYIPLYSTISTVMVGGDVATVENDTGYIQLADQFSNTYADLATRAPLLQAVINALGLNTTPKKLADYVTAAVVENTQLVEISASDNNPKLAAAIADETARQLTLYTPPGVRNFVLLVEQADVPTFPSFTYFLVPIVAGLLGMLLVGGVAFLIEFMRNPVYSADELNHRTNIPVLAVIRPRGKAAGKQRRQHERKLPRWRRVSDAPWWPLVQACHRQIEALNSSSTPKLYQVMVTSATLADRREKALVAANVAAAWARSGARVMLVEADLDSPLLAKWFKLPQKPGLADLLGNAPDEGQIQAALQPTDTPGLSLLPVGNVQDNTYDGLTTRSFEQLLNQLSKHADAIVVDGPPMLTGGEGAVIAKHMQGVLLMMNAGRTRLEAITDARDALTVAQSNFWGAILVDGVKVR